MDVKAKARFIRQSPQKTRLVVDVIRGMKIEKALDQLTFINKKAALSVKKLLNSAIANAVNNFDLDRDNLFVKSISVDESSILKRWMPRAHGRATPKYKRTSHINITLGELVDSGVKKAKAVKAEEPMKIAAQPKNEDGVKVEKKRAKSAKPAAEGDVKGDQIVDPRMEGHGKHTKIEGSGTKGFAGKMFRRKSG